MGEEERRRVRERERERDRETRGWQRKRGKYMTKTKKYNSLVG